MKVRILLLLLTASAVGCDDPCKPGPEPTLEIGTGDASFESLGDTTQLVHGPQGGFHLLLSLRVTHLLGSEFMGGEVTGSIDGVQMADERPWLDFTCNTDTESLETSGHFLIYDTWPDEPDREVTPQDLHLKTTTIEMTVNDLEGTRVSASATTTIVDPCQEGGAPFCE